MIFLIYIGASIVVRIIIQIIFHIINAIATREEKVPVTDERDKLITYPRTDSRCLTSDMAAKVRACGLKSHYSLSSHP